jgi:hypothetical protein
MVKQAVKLKVYLPRKWRDMHLMSRMWPWTTNELAALRLRGGRLVVTLRGRRWSPAELLARAGRREQVAGVRG